MTLPALVPLEGVTRATGRRRTPTRERAAAAVGDRERLAAGLEPPSVPLNARLPGVTDRAGPGGGGVTVSVTGITRGEPVAPVAAIVTFPV